MSTTIKLTLLACAVSALVPISGIAAPAGAGSAVAPEPAATTAPSDDADAPIAALSGEMLATLPADGRVFEFMAGDTLKSALARWCRSAGWTLVWRVDVDYPIHSAGTLGGSGDFQSAVEQTLHAYWLQSADLKASLYTRNRHLVISGLAGRRR